MTPSETKWLEQLADWHTARAKEQPADDPSREPGSHNWHLTAARIIDVITTDHDLGD